MGQPCALCIGLVVVKQPQLEAWRWSCVVMSSPWGVELACAGPPLPPGTQS
jgi:hypothetical protein